MLKFEQKILTLYWSVLCVLKAWLRNQMETFSALLALWAGITPVTDDIPARRPITPNFDVFFDLHLNKRLSKQWWGWWFKTQSHPLWRHCNGWVKYNPKGRVHLKHYKCQQGDRHQFKCLNILATTIYQYLYTNLIRPQLNALDWRYRLTSDGIFWPHNSLPNKQLHCIPIQT